MVLSTFLLNIYIESPSHLSLLGNKKGCTNWEQQTRHTQRMYQFILLNQHSLSTPLMQEIAPSNDGMIEY